MKKAIIFGLILLLVVSVLLGCLPSPAPPPLKNTEIVFPEPDFCYGEFSVYKAGEIVLEMEEFTLGTEEQLAANIKLKGIDYPISMLGRLEESTGTNLSIYVQYRLGDLEVDGLFDYQTPVVDQEIYQKILSLREHPRVQEVKAQMERLDIARLVQEDLPSLKAMLLDEKDREELEQLLNLDPRKPLSYYLHSDVGHVINFFMSWGFGLLFPPVLDIVVGSLAETYCFLIMCPSEKGTGGGQPVSPCGPCDGTGKVKCPRCDGSGTVRKCYDCTGTGVVRQCAECDGGGLVYCPETGLIKPCPACGGTGDSPPGPPGEEVPCGTCGGSGIAPPGAPAILAPCTACGGTGKLTCPYCHGRRH